MTKQIFNQLKKGKRMKRIAFILLAATFIVLAACDAQKREIRSVNNAVQRGNVQEAKERIDTIIEGEAATNPEAWVTKAQVYLEIFASEDPYVKDLHPSPLAVADEALQKAEELDAEGDQTFFIITQKELLGRMYINAGLEEFNAERFSMAAANFYRSYEIDKSFGGTDNMVLYYAAIAAARANLLEDAKKYLTEYLEIGYQENEDFSETDVYVLLINVLTNLEDEDETEKWIAKAKEIDPVETHIDIIFAEANYYLRIGDAEGAEQAINAAIDRQPDNPDLHRALGDNYQRVVQDESLSPEVRQDAFDKAVESYENSLELNPDQYTVVFFLGAMYFEKGRELFQEADEIYRDCMATENYHCPEYVKKEAEMKEMWLKAQPYLEEAKGMLDESHEDFEAILNSLANLYARTNQNEKLQEIMEIRKSLGIE